MARAAAGAAVLAVLAMLGGLWWFATGAGGDDPFVNCREGQVAGGSAAIGGPFTLVSETGETVTSEQVIDKPTLIYFGYTFCPDVCPLDAARNAQAVNLLAERGYDVKPVFITVDPDRDTPEVLAEFTDYLHPEMLGLTGTPEQIKRAADAFKVYYARQPGGDPEYYLMQHTSFSYLMLPGHGFVEFFRGAPGAGGAAGLEAEALADRAQCFLDAAGLG